MADDQHILVNKKRFEELEDKELKLEMLEAHGVDNWQGYPDAMEDYDAYKRGEDPYA